MLGFELISKKDWDKVKKSLPDYPYYNIKNDPKLIDFHKKISPYIKEKFIVKWIGDDEVNISTGVILNIPPNNNLINIKWKERKNYNQYFLHVFLQWIFNGEMHVFKPKIDLDKICKKVK